MRVIFQVDFWEVDPPVRPGVLSVTVESEGVEVLISEKARVEDLDWDLARDCIVALGPPEWPSAYAGTPISEVLKARLNHIQILAIRALHVFTPSTGRVRAPQGRLAHLLPRPGVLHDPTVPPENQLVIFGSHNQIETASAATLELFRAGALQRYAVRTSDLDEQGIFYRQASMPAVDPGAFSRAARQILEAMDGMLRR